MLGGGGRGGFGHFCGTALSEKKQSTLAVLAHTHTHLFLYTERGGQRGEKKQISEKKANVTLYEFNRREKKAK